VNGNDVFALYNFKTKTGKKFRNTELFKFNRDNIMAIEVYFGESILRILFLFKYDIPSEN
jgi:hypothetical protein